MNKKNILFWGELPPKITHGISLSSARIIKHLAARFNVLIIEDASAFANNIKTILLSFRAYLAISRLAKKKIDIFYINMPMSYLGLWRNYIAIRVMLLFSPNTVIVSHLHRGDFVDFYNILKHRKITDRFLNLVSTLIVLSHRSKSELVSATRVNERKITVLYNSVNVKKEPLQKENFKNTVNYCLSNYIPSKRIHSLVKIANEKDINIDFNGTITDDSYMKKLEEININNKCKLNGIITGDDKINKIKESRFMIIPSLNEGMPLVILESLSKGTPVICFDVGYIKEYVGNSYPGLVNDLTDEALSKKILELNSLSNEQYLKLCKQSYDIFWSRFDPKLINEQASSIFNQAKSI